MPEQRLDAEPGEPGRGGPRGRPPAGAGPARPMTAAGLHAEVERLAAARVPPPASVLDLGCGEGAWAERLMRRGYSLTCADRATERFRLEGARFVALDLDREFAGALGGPFDLVTAIEVIEHLERPTDFLRQCAALLHARGRLVLTTPNVEGVGARLRFLATGELRMFGEDARLNDPTHISPMHTLLFRRLCARAGLRVLEHHAAGGPAATRWSSRLLAGLVAPFVRGYKGGSCHVYVLARAEAEGS